MSLKIKSQYNGKELDYRGQYEQRNKSRDLHDLILLMVSLCANFGHGDRTWTKLMNMRQLYTSMLVDMNNNIIKV